MFEQLVADRSEGVVDDLAVDRVEDAVEKPEVLEGLGQVQAPLAALMGGVVLRCVGIGIEEPFVEAVPEPEEHLGARPAHEQLFVAGERERSGLGAAAGAGEELDVVRADRARTERLGDVVHGPQRTTQPQMPTRRRAFDPGPRGDPRRRVLRAVGGPLAAAVERLGLPANDRLQPGEFALHGEHRVT